MFTGIVKGVCEVVSLTQQQALSTLGIAIPVAWRDGLTHGASIAVNGTCLTVVREDEEAVYFDAMIETLRRTSLGRLQVGDRVNIERAARFNDEIGGHLLSGHVIDQVTVRTIEYPDEHNCRMVFDVPAQWMKYILPKGYIGLDGCSLTVGEVDETGFSVYLIPETRKLTLFGERQQGDHINLEVDSQTQATVDTVERLLLQRGLA